MDKPHDRLRPQDGWLQRLGWFRFYFNDGRWAWSPQVEQMHGYRPGTVQPDAELALSHVHPDDYRRVADTLYRMGGRHRPFTSRHRIVDGRNLTRDVVMIGTPFDDRHGAPVGIQGVYFDMTPAGRAAQPAQSDYDRVAARLRMKAGGHGDGQRDRIRAATRC